MAANHVPHTNRNIVGFGVYSILFAVRTHIYRVYLKIKIKDMLLMVMVMIMIPNDNIELCNRLFFLSNGV
jgi:hypothetical protein